MDAILTDRHDVNETAMLQHGLNLPSLFILGVRVDNIDSETALRMIRQFVSSREQATARRVFFTNVHSIHLARLDQELLRTINDTDLALPDGSGLKIAGRVFGHSIRENLNGTDFLPIVLRHAESAGWTVYLLGAQPQVIEVCHGRLLAQYPRLRVVGFHHGHFHRDEECAVLDEINARQPDLLLVALGSPLQETWIARHAPYLKVGVCFAVGGLFDFLSGVRKRAPVWMRRWGIEWFFRFIQDPQSKWNRVFIEIPWFLALVLAKRLVSRPGRFRLRKRFAA